MTSLLIAEKEQQIHAAALQPLEELLLGARSLENIALQAQPVGELVLEKEVRLALLADALPHFDIQVLPGLLADGELRSQSTLNRRRNLEGVEVQRVADRL